MTLNSIVIESLTHCFILGYVVLWAFT